MLFITELELLDDSDRLEIYDGSTTNMLLASYTGSSIPPSIVSTGSSMLVRFVTNAAGDSGRGFEAAYHAVCAAGYLWNEVSASCQACPVGSYSEIANAPTCKPCPLGTYALSTGATVCTSCPTAATTSSPGAYLLQACTCQAGYYGWDNTCFVCPTGAECPGGNLVRALYGWCEAPVSVNGSASRPAYKHCCVPSKCPGGVAAACDGSVPTVGTDNCAVREISWDSMGQVSVTTGTWITFLLLSLLLLLLTFCMGVLTGVRRMLQKYLQRTVVPTEESDLSDLKQAQFGSVEMAPIMTPVQPFSPAPVVMPLPQTPAPVPERPAETPLATEGGTPFNAAMAGRTMAAWEPGPHGGEDIMIVDVDDLLNAHVPPPAMPSSAPPPPPVTQSDAAAAADSGHAVENAGGELANSEAGGESAETPKKKKKKKGKVGDDDEGGEAAAEASGDEAEGKKGTKKEKKEKNRKKSKDVGEEASEAEAEAEGEGEGGGGNEKKKKKKKKKAEE